MSAQSWCTYILAGQPTLVCPCEEVYKTLLTSLSLILQQCSACLVCLTWKVFDIYIYIYIYLHTHTQVTYCHVVSHWEKSNKELLLFLHVWISQRLTVKRQIKNVGQLRLAVEGRKNEGQAICTPWPHSGRLTGEGRR